MPLWKLATTRRTFRNLPALTGAISPRSSAYNQPRKARYFGRTSLTVALLFASVAVTLADDAPLLLLRSRPGSELVIVEVDLEAALARGDITPDALTRVQAFDAADGTSIPIQYVPSPALDNSLPPASARLLLRLPNPTTQAIRLNFDGPSAESEVRDEIALDLADATVTHKTAQQAGLPSSFVFHATGKVFDQFAWNDRVHHREQGGFLLRHDTQPSVTLVSKGPLCSVVRVEAAYQRTDGTRPDSQPEAVYDFHYFHNEPVAYVTAVISQESRFAWNEVHFLELNYPGNDFTGFIGGEPEKTGTLVGDNSSHRFPDWAALVHEEDAIAMFDCGTVLVYDGRGQYGTYLHADGDRSWQTWDDLVRRYAGWIWIGHDQRPAAAISAWRKRMPAVVDGVLSRASVHRQIALARGAASDTTESADQLWRVALAEQLEATGRLDEAINTLHGRLPANWTAVPGGDLQLTLECQNDGIRLISLFDTQAQHEHLAAVPTPLFEITLRHANSAEQISLRADRGWGETTVTAPAPGISELSWKSPHEPALTDLQVVAKISADPASSALRWQLSITPPPTPWSVWQVRFPQIALATPGDAPALLFPRGPGEVSQDAWQSNFVFEGRYPSGWMSMQFLAAYDRGTRRGLYWAIHDPLGSTKTLSARSRPSEHSVVLFAEYPAPDMGKPENGFELCGEAVWQGLSGDWYDAALIYRDWVQQHARWYPSLSVDGRGDTPMWMRELCVWAQTGGSPEQCVDEVRRFAEYLGVPVGFHWYSWHQIPFDNDYPHYFPVKEGFEQAVRTLRDAQVHVMPYINGRLWDTRDRGLEDFEFTRRALAAATKDEQGKPYTESYGSKESDGSPVELAVMCPTTSTWQNEVKGIISRLFQECGVDGVYIDQIAAAAPTTCQDAQHGHSLGGGHWWNTGYWTMLERIREDMQPDQMLTTECNAEPFVRWLDGYLTWHWQYDGQVPAFPAVYGGAIQMFGRAYRGGDTRDLALRMKSAQQLVYGEQIGWLHPNVVNQPENAAFLREVVRLRWQLRRYFHAGHMLRPPALAKPVPTVRADWQWQNEWWVETDALLRGAWQLPDQETAVAIFANVSDQDLEVEWSYDAKSMGWDATQVTLTRITSEGAGDAEIVPAAGNKKLKVPARSLWAAEIALVE